MHYTQRALSNHINFVSLREILSLAVTKYTCIQKPLQWQTVGKRLINLHIGLNTHIQPCNFPEAFREYDYIHIQPVLLADDYVCVICVITTVTESRTVMSSQVQILQHHKIMMVCLTALCLHP